MQRTLVTQALTFALLLTAVGCKPPPPASPEADAAPEAEAPLPGGEMSQTVTASAVVLEIDQDTRMVTLQKADQSELRFRASAEVANLAQVQVGDEVTVEYYESIAYQVVKASEGAVPTTVEEYADLAPLGDKPGAEEVRVTTMTTTIVAIDKVAGTVTLENPTGAQTTIKARDRRNLELVSVGDLVDIQITEAVAVSVTTPNK